MKHIDCVVICDHNTISGSIAAQKILPRFGIKVISGEEIFTASGEIIGLFLSNTIPHGLSAKATVDEIKKQGGLVYVPHPYDLKRQKTVLNIKALLQIVENIDFIEIHNGRNIDEQYSKKQREIFKKYLNKDRTIPVCGSDAHTFFELGRNYMVLPEINCDNPSLFKRDFMTIKMVTNRNQPISHMVTKIAKLIKLIFKGDLYELHRVISRRCKKRDTAVG